MSVRPGVHGADEVVLVERGVLEGLTLLLERGRRSAERDGIFLDRKLVATVAEFRRLADGRRAGNGTPVKDDCGTVRLMSSSEIALAAGCGARYVRKLACDGALPGAKRVAGRWLIPEGAFRARNGES